MARRPSARARHGARCGGTAAATQASAGASGDALGMLARRGLRPSLARPDLPFSSDIAAETADALAAQLGHYAFRLFVRGVIHHGDGFTPDEPTSYVSRTQARLFTETLVVLGVVAANARDRIRLVRRAGVGGDAGAYRRTRSAAWLGFDVATGVKFHSARHRRRSIWSLRQGS